MTSASCEGPMCTYTGPESGAEHGECTGTGGYISNGEISALIAEQRVSREWTDKTESNYIIYDGKSGHFFSNKSLVNFKPDFGSHI